MAAVGYSDTGCTLTPRDGTALEAAATCAVAWLWPSTCASAVYCLLCAGLSLTAPHRAVITAGCIDSAASAEATWFPSVQQARLWLP